MKAEQAKKLADNALDTLAAALKAGKSESLTAYLAAMGRFHEYSWGNVMLIVSQKPDATHVAGFQTWKSLGRFVKKGEHGIVIIAPMLIKAKEQAAGSAEEQKLLRFKAVYVFDVSQTDGEPLAEFAQVSGDPREHTDRLKTFVASRGITLEYAEHLAGARGRSFGGRIQLLSGMTPAEEFSVLAHEVAHELLHHGERRNETSKTIRETEAEAVAFVVSQAIGLEVGTHAADYIQLYDGNTDTLAESLEFVQKTAATIIAAIAADESLAEAA
ncbi:MAG: ArdC-like ssDNA-binding domain-containing protein [Phycisphaerae bacterium]|nr:ArdC-like ssDNA-binding domain-containing protein [Phycisphaerae bacterium]